MINRYPYTDFHELNLDWFLEQFKELVANWEQFREDLTNDWDSVKNDWTALYNYVHDYFDNLDVQNEIDRKLDQMLIDHDLDAPIASAAGAWLSDNLATPSTPPIDTTLSVTSAAADAKVVGDNFKISLMGVNSVVDSGHPILSDADNATVQKIYTIAQSGMVSNLPADAKDTGTLITYSFSDSAQGGNSQIFIDEDGKMYHRIKWGTYPGTWQAWKLTSNGYQLNGYGQTTSNSTPNMTDANNAVVNKVYTITDTSLVTNLPTISRADDRGTLFTLSFSNDQRGGNAQFFIDQYGKMYQRMRWGAYPGTWGSWMLTSNGAMIHGNLQAVTNSSILSDANDAEVNTVHCISNQNIVSNLPAGGYNTGNLITYSFSNNKQGGNAQIFIDQSGMAYTRIRWGAMPGTWGSWSRITNNKSLVSLFTSMAVIGDSFASGEVYVGGQLTDFPNMSWLQILARANGISDASNYSKGGLTCRTWQTDAAGLPAMQADTPKQLYFVNLGINDANASIPVGTYSDFTAGTHPDTYYGNLGAIKDEILTANANAIICWITPMRFGSPYDAYTAAVADIATQQGDLLIDCRNIAYYQSAQYKTSLVSNHPVSYSYAAIANEIENALTDAMVGNAKMKVFNY